METVSLLLVDDEPLFLKTLAHMLRKEGLDVITATNVEEALSVLEARPVNCVVTDLVLKGMDGLELTRKIKKTNPGIMVVIITAYGRLDAAIEAIRAEADDFILKDATPRGAVFQIMRCVDRLRLQITEKELMERMVDAEKLAATGRLASYIAHQINSPLQGVLALLRYLEKTHTTDTELIENIDLIHEAFTIIHDTVKRLLQLNQPLGVNKQHININNSIRGMAVLLQSALRQNRIKVVYRLNEQLPDIIGSAPLLSHLFLNLFNNAIEAIAGTGTKTGAGYAGTITVTTDCTTSGIRIVIEDDGPGIEKAKREHLFDLFYSGKPEGGLGLGLSIAREIVMKHNGTITAENKDCGGARFLITIPLYESCEDKNGTTKNSSFG
jgi:signal transduction histidine kinase